MPEQPHRDTLALFLDTCRRLSQGDEDLVARLRDAGFVCEPFDWSFTLPAVHAWLATDEPYPRFRQRLFASRFNQWLEAFDMRVVIEDNRGKVDANRYRLCRRPAPQDSSPPR
ncbi:hypothetical protein [Pseudomonas sp. RIT-PI-AD]|uniref:hypothetical protein n=1 Tax=Pseudomonas sp. RIT-PI-AD TaxID=3035294 RepID=UPI0021DA0EFC|nr:hypothetical protein [Pseudomonas sp. RIT-PI-AD]